MAVSMLDSKQCISFFLEFVIMGWTNDGVMMELVVSRRVLTYEGSRCRSLECNQQRVTETVQTFRDALYVN